MNWGNKLLIAFIAFAGLMSYMVYRCIQTPVDLVTKEYYKDELAYQDIIDRTANANALSGKIKLEQDKKWLLIQFPADLNHMRVSGEISFYCPSDSRKDRKMALEPDGDGRQQFDITEFFPGKYTVKIKWEGGRVKYYAEEPFTIF